MTATLNDASTATGGNYDREFLGGVNKQFVTNFMYVDFYGYPPEQGTTDEMMMLEVNFLTLGKDTDYQAVNGDSVIYNYMSYNGQSVSCAQVMKEDGTSSAEVRNFYKERESDESPYHSLYDEEDGVVTYDQQSAAWLVSKPVEDNEDDSTAGQTRRLQDNPSVDNLCDGEESTKYCPLGFPDLDNICQHMYEFPADQFIGLDLQSFCAKDANEGELCAHYPEMCNESGKPTQDVCDSNPALCLSAPQPEPNKCIGNIETCMQDPSFSDNKCDLIPALCAIGSVEDQEDDLLLFEEKGSSEIFQENGEFTLSCSAYIRKPLAEVKQMIQDLNYYYNLGIEDGSQIDFQVDWGQRFYSSSADKSFVDIVAEEDQKLQLLVPELRIVSEEAQAAADELEEFLESDSDEDEDEQDYIDVMGSSYNYITTGENDEYYLESSVELGYKVAEQVFDIDGNDISEDTYIGFIFTLEAPDELIEDGQIITQWARYSLDTGADGEPVSAAVSCTSIVGDPESTVVTTYQSAANIEDLDDPNLADFIVDGDEGWQMIGVASGYYGKRASEYEGYSRIYCLAAQEWSTPEGDDLSFGNFKVESGARAAEADGTVLGDIDHDKWLVTYRAPYQKAETTFDIQEVFKNSEVPLGGSTIEQSLSIGYEIVQDIYSDNNLIFLFAMDAPTDNITADDQVIQYAAFKKKFDTTAQSHMVGCITQGDDYKVVMWRDLPDFSVAGFTALLAEDVQNLDSLSEDYLLTYGEDIWFEARPKDALYAQAEGSAADRAVQRCFAGMPFGKDAETAELLAGDYTVIMGAAIKDASRGISATTPVKHDLTLKGPEYTNEDLIEELEEAEGEYFESLFYHAEDLSYADANGDEQTATYSIEGKFFAETTGDSRMEVEFVSRFDDPEQLALFQGNYFYNYVSFQEVEDKRADPAKVVCRTEVGERLGYSVSQMIPSTDFDDETTLFNQEATAPAADSLFTASDDAKKYETGYDSFRCTIMLVNNELNRDRVQDIFGKVYSVEFGLYVFQNADSVRDVNEESIFNSFEMQLPAPGYDNDFDDDLSNVLFEDASDIYDGEFGYYKTQVSLNITKEFYEPNTLSIRQETKYNNSTDDKYILHWGQIRFAEQAQPIIYQWAYIVSYFDDDSVSCFDNVLGEQLFSMVWEEDNSNLLPYFCQAINDINGKFTEDLFYGQVQQQNTTDTDALLITNVMLDFSKQDENVNYGKYQIEYGIVVFLENHNQIFEQRGSNFFVYDEPAYDFGEETIDENEIVYTELAYKEAILDDRLAKLDIGGFGWFSISAYYEVNPYISLPDQLSVAFYTDAPSKLFTDVSYTMQYMQLLVDGEDIANGVQTVACITDPQGNSTVVNYESTTSIKDDKTTSVFNQLSGFEVADGSFAASSNEWDSYRDSYDEQTYQRCVVVMDIPKINRDSSVFQKYEVRAGLKQFDNEQDASPKDLANIKFRFKFEEPGKEQADPEIVNALEEVVKEEDKYDPEYVEVETQVIGAKTAEITLDAGGVAEQRFYTAFAIGATLDKTDTLDFFFELDLPKSEYRQGEWIYQFAALQPAGESDRANQVTFTCAVQVGNPFGAVVDSFEGTGDFAFTATSGSTMKEQNINDIVTPRELVKPDSEDFYGLADSDLDWANKVQKCQAQLPIDSLNLPADLFQEYDVVLGARMYTDAGVDTAPKKLNEISYTYTLTEPEYDFETEIDPEVGFAADIERELQEMKAQYSNKDIAADSSDIPAVMNQSLWVDNWVNKKVNLPDQFSFTWSNNVEANQGVVADGDIAISWIQLKKDGSGTDVQPTTVVCKTVIGQEGSQEVLMYKGSAKFDRATIESANWSDLQGELNNAPERLEKFRVASPWMYYSNIDQGTDEDNYSWDYASFNCIAEMDLPKNLDNSAILGDYSASSGTFLLNGDSVKQILTEDNFALTIVAPDYQFGEAFEFVEDIYEEEIFRSVDMFDVGTIDAAAVDAIGFTQIKGSFNAVPNFETTFWRFTFGLEIPAEYFDLEASYYAYVTYQRVDEAAPPSTIGCYTNFNNTGSAPVGFEYDDSFDNSPSNLTPDVFEFNAAAKQEYSNWDISADLDDYQLIETTNGKMRQTCAVEIRIEPEEVAEFFNTDYKLTYSGAIYQSYDSDVKVADLPVVNANFAVPAADFQFEDKEIFSVDLQVWSEQIYNFDSETIWTDVEDIVGTKTEQYFKGAFEVGFEETSKDKLSMIFELDAPPAVLKKGTVVYQWMQYTKTNNDTYIPTTIGCMTKVGFSTVSVIDTFKGRNSFFSNATESNIVDQVWSSQNYKQVAKKSESFGLNQESSWYKSQDSPYIEGNTLQPCIAEFQFKGKLADEKDLFGDYTFTIGARIYENDKATTFYTVPEQQYETTLGEPITDFAAEYEEQVEEDKQVIIESFKKSGKAKIIKAFPDYEGDEVWAFQSVIGGYKLYESEDATKRWFFQFAVELPTSLFTDGQVIQQWIQYEDLQGDESNDFGQSGAVSCKVQVGDSYLSKADQWNGIVNLSSENSNVQGKKWYKQQSDSKENYPDYYAPFWSTELFSLTDSNRPIGAYSKQICSVEIHVSADLDPANFKLNVGSRLYDSEDAIEFKTIAEKQYDWLQFEIEFSPELQVVPVYVKENAQAIVNTLKELPAVTQETLLAEFAELIEKYLASQTTTEEDDTEAPVVQAALKQESDDYTVKQTFSSGFQVYEGITASDFWWFYLALDIPDFMVEDGAQIYQFITFQDQAGQDEPWTIGCYRGKSSDDSAIDVFIQDSDDLDLLKSDSDKVIGNLYDAQAAAYKEDLSQSAWSAGKDYANEAPVSTIELNSNNACYFSMELPKIGRNPSDFGHVYDITLGARVYNDPAAAEFSDLGSASETLDQGAPAEFVVQVVEEPESAISMISSFAACIMVLFALNF